MTFFTFFQVYHWRSKIVTEGQTKALVQKIKSNKELRLNKNDEADIIQEQRKILQKSWKPWIVGDFERSCMVSVSVCSC